MDNIIPNHRLVMPRNLRLLINTPPKFSLMFQSVKIHYHNNWKTHMGQKIFTVCIGFLILIMIMDTEIWEMVHPSPVILTVSNVVQMKVFIELFLIHLGKISHGVLNRGKAFSLYILKILIILNNGVIQMLLTQTQG